MAETNIITAGVSIKDSPRRNYQLDFLKFIFTMFVFWAHSSVFIGVNTNIILPSMLGDISVHFFYVISGMFMVNSYMKGNTETTEPGKTAANFVIRKFKGMALQYYTALFIFLAIYIYIYIYIYIGFVSIKDVLKIFYMTFPEIFMVQRAGVMLEYNGPTWYLSAMFLSMWLLVYILYKHKDFFMYILAPLLAVFMLGFMYQTNNRHLAGHATFYGIVLGAIIRAICGLCFGVVAWLINDK